MNFHPQDLVINDHIRMIFNIFNIIIKLIKFKNFSYVLDFKIKNILVWRIYFVVGDDCQNILKILCPHILFLFLYNLLLNTQVWLGRKIAFYW